jgi:hypothetical protein
MIDPTMQLIGDGVIQVFLGAPPSQKNRAVELCYKVEIKEVCKEQGILIDPEIAELYKFLPYRFAVSYIDAPAAQYRGQSERGCGLADVLASGGNENTPVLHGVGFVSK